MLTFLVFSGGLACRVIDPVRAGAIRRNLHGRVPRFIKLGLHHLTASGVIKADRGPFGHLELGRLGLKRIARPGIIVRLVHPLAAVLLRGFRNQQMVLVIAPGNMALGGAVIPVFRRAILIITQGTVKVVLIRMPAALHAVTEKVRHGVFIGAHNLRAVAGELRVAGDIR
ncbi:hypothetical protein ID856_15260 [Xenorhabdus sp. 18]|uniref:hypothetical protein n=1 Tax=Xenorhabdus doucetiae TaxID=351671 RepID=UPI0019C959FE|nr:hypothetical protein [Xenorhabdus sp. 18]MBD2797885.1 hypothetical protein [Xenorhabdus sp. 18]